MDATPDGGDPACHLHLLCPDCGAVASERLAPCCSRYAGPVRHPWLGVLRPDGEGGLVGWIAVAAEGGPPAADGDTSCEVRIGPDGTGDGPAGLDDVAARVRHVLEGLDALRAFALAHAPAPWLRLCAAMDGPPAPERLFLDGLDVVSSDAAEATFSHAGLRPLRVRVDGRGRGREVLP
ncbi:hypothetical protein ACIA8F_15240 [Streptomyces sp. NPDC051563]|uniref:hypothetical protein n=1 Tax=Streptomyces sp. NPDC051563 TaxID=3365659 RepID=UPI0037A03C6A